MKDRPFPLPVRAMLASAALLVAQQAQAQTVADDEILTVDSCREIATFEARFPDDKARFKSELDERRAQYCKPPPPPTPPVKNMIVRPRNVPAPIDPPPPPPPALQQSVRLDAGGSGEGDARTVAEALAKVADGGTIYVVPGEIYYASVAISRHVNFIALPGAEAPRICASSGKTITVYGDGAVLFRGIDLCNAYGNPALSVLGGSATIIGGTISGLTNTPSFNPVVEVRSAKAQFENVEIQRLAPASIGSTNPALQGSGTFDISVSGGRISNATGWGVYLESKSYSSAVFDRTAIDGSIAVHLGESSRARFTACSFTANGNSSAVQLHDQASGAFVSNRFEAARPFYRVQGTTLTQWEGNLLAGSPLAPPVAQVPTN